MQDVLFCVVTGGFFTPQRPPASVYRKLCRKPNPMFVLLEKYRNYIRELIKLPIFKR